MSGAGRTDAPMAPWVGLLMTPRFAAILSLLGIGIAALSFLATKLFGWAGYLAALGVLVVLMAVVLILRRNDLEWRGIPPISLLAFVGWAAISLAWSQFQWATLGGIAYLFAYTFIAIFIAYTRDTIQIVRAMGDVLRVVIALSIVLELFSGLLIDMPIPFLGIGGHLAELGPMSGVVQTRNQFGLIAIIGAVTFATELRTRSVPILTGVLSLVAAVVCIGLTRSALIYGAALIVLIAAAVLFGIRRVRPERRQLWQFIVLGVTILFAIAGWIFRGRIVTFFNADGDLDYRLHLWQKIVALLPGYTIQGWGWIGHWQTDVAPFFALTTEADRPASSAFNAYLDVLFQLGLIGFVIFVGMLGLAFTRSWLLAGRRRSIMYAWPALSLIALIIVSLAESSILADFGWLVFAICCMKASQELSWRRALSVLPEPPAAEPPTPQTARPDPGPAT